MGKNIPIKQKRTFRFVFFLIAGLLVQQASAMEIKPLSQNEKDAIVLDLKKVIDDGKYEVELKSTMNSYVSKKAQNGQTISVPKGGLYFKNGKYKVLIRYENNDFPTLYGGASRFSDNNSIEFYRNWSKVIFEHYLGFDYQRYEPELYAITSNAAIFVSISGTEELKELLKDSRVMGASHIGSARVDPEEVFP